MSADPLAVHLPGEADPNLYAYVRGAALKATDPLGLQEMVNDQNADKGAVQRFVEGVIRGAVGGTIEMGEGAANTMTPAGDAPQPGASPTVDFSEAKPNVPMSDAGQAGFVVGYLGVQAVTIWGAVRGIVKGGSGPNASTTRQAAAAPKATSEPTVEIYRGVNETHVRYAESAEGMVKPSSPDWKFWERPKATPLEHNTKPGGTEASPFTSWTYSKEVAEHFARWVPGQGKVPGKGGVVLTARVQLSRLVQSPNLKSVWTNGKLISEEEVLIRNALEAQGVEFVQNK